MLNIKSLKNKKLFAHNYYLPGKTGKHLHITYTLADCQAPGNVLCWPCRHRYLPRCCRQCVGANGHASERRQTAGGAPHGPRPLYFFYTPVLLRTCITVLLPTRSLVPQRFSWLAAFGMHLLPYFILAAQARCPNDSAAIQRNWANTRSLL